MRRILSAAIMLTGMFLYAKETFPEPSAEAGTLPPQQYIIDYYAPPPDWIPAREIRDYSLNTRVPDLFWLKYDNAYTLALRIKPITKERLEKDLEVDLIDKKRENAALSFSEADEKKDENRQIIIRNLNVPADDFIEFSFKMKAKNPAAAVKVFADGVATVDVTKDADAETKCLDGFKAYKVKFPAKKKAVLRQIRIQLPPSEAYNPEEEYVFFDLNLKRNAPKARFTDIPQRQWITKSAFAENRPLTVKDGIPDVYAYVNSNPKGVESLALPMSGYETREQTEKDKDGGFKVENVKEKINGKEVDAIRITLEKGPRCYLKFPIKFDATKFNTMTFMTKIELPEGLDPRKLYRDTYPMLLGTDAATLNGFFDTFSFGLTSATHDHMDWNRFGVSQGLTASHWQRNAKVPEGWRTVAFDFMNSDQAGNKSSFYPEITHWCFYYNNAKIPEGKKVVITIANPKVSAGLMYAGGDMERYKKFLAEKGKFIMKDFSDGSKYLGAPETNRLAEPLPFIRNHVPQAEIILPQRSYYGAYKIIVDRALDYFQDLLKNKYGLSTPIPVLAKPSDKDNVKIFLGDNHYSAVDKAQYESDMNTLKGTPGCAIRTKGKNIYIYAGQFNYSGAARGIANGIYLFLENNTDEIMAGAFSASRWEKQVLHPVFAFAKDGNMDIVWGDGYLNVPPLKVWSVTGSDKDYQDRNLSSPDDWATGTWDYGGIRQLSTNHWWGYGAYLVTADGKEDRKTPNDKWGLDENGKRMVPGCYTGHPCLINVLDDAKEAYLAFALKKAEDNPQAPKGKAYYYKTQDLMGLWVEDTLKVCKCDKCKTPIRLSNGSVVTPDDPAFLGTQFYSNACAMINAVNVHAKRDMQIESIAYFWMSPIPLFEISRNYKIRFCPYIRKNYFEPIYAPCNDLFWRDMYRWSQLNITLGIYEYFLGVNFRPFATIFPYDIEAEKSIGLQTATPEGGGPGLEMLERWVYTRLFWDPNSDPNKLRKYYIWRTFREAAPEMEKFYFLLNNCIWESFAYNQPTEFEDEEQLMIHALRSKSPNANALNPNLTVADEMIASIEKARKEVKNPMARKVLDELYARWEKYLEAARKKSEILKKETEKRKN